MILSATVNDQISLGAIVAVLTIIAVGVGLYVQFRSEGPWQTVAKGREEENKLLDEKIDLLTKENAILKQQKDTTVLTNLVATLTGSVAALSKHVADIGLDLAEHRKDTAGMSAAITSTLQNFGSLLKDFHREIEDHRDHALERHKDLIKTLETIRVERSPSERTRSTDEVEMRDADG
jgi:hypothetical protein